MSRYKIKHYSLGFVFSRDKKDVLMINKKRPDWQKGKLNGIGGKVIIEERENYLICMKRECFEETGLKIKAKWNEIGHITEYRASTDSRGYYIQEDRVGIFCCFSNMIYKAKTTTDEKIEIVSVVNLLKNKKRVVKNIVWIVEFALSKQPGLLTYTQHRNTILL
jgi:8-oxo-dGTP diphosphatase